MMPSGEPRTLWVDTDRFALYREGPSLLLEASGRAPTRVPLSRVSRAVIQGHHHSAGVLDACLALAASGAVVHFPGTAERPSIRLQPEQAPTNDVAAEVADLISQQSGLGPFNWWADCQRRHAWSLVFARSFQGDFAAARTRLHQYLQRIGPGHYFAHEVDALEMNLRQWLAAELHRSGWISVAQILSARGARMEQVLHECLYIPLLWRFTGWRRQQAYALPGRERVRFFELETVGRLSEQLHRHLRALAREYHVSWRRQLADPESSDG